MFDSRKPSFSPSWKANRPTVAALATLVLTLTSGRALAQDTPAEPNAGPAEASQPQPAAPAEASEPQPAAPIEAAKAEPAPPPPAAKPETPPAPPPAPAVEWKVQAKGGFIMTSGNSQATNVNFGVKGSRKEGNNKLELEGGVAYGRSSNLVANVDKTTASPILTGFSRDNVVSTNNWATKGRYDRFLSENNIVYASTQWAADKIAGKTLFGGGQVGYSRQLLKDKWNLSVVELGYDFSYERYVQQGSEPVTIHSARMLVGETLSLTRETGLTASVEALLNLNKETKAIDVSNGNKGVDAFHDTRINGKVGISTNLFKKLGLGVSFTLKYDQNPAQRPYPAGAQPIDTTYQSWEYSDKVDTLTEVTLLYTFF
jgi:hypothetical protein